MFERMFTRLLPVVAVCVTTLGLVLPPSATRSQWPAITICTGGGSVEEIGDNSASARGDKSGTTATLKNERAPQVAVEQHVAGHGSFVTEREGFEPSLRI